MNEQDPVLPDHASPEVAPEAVTPESSAQTTAPSQRTRRKRRRGGARASSAQPGQSPADDAGETPSPAAEGEPVAKPQPQADSSRGRQRKVNAVLDKLFELHPALFGARFLPLKRGVYEDLLARHPEAFQPDELKLALGLHARSTRYLEAVASGQQRHDLDAQPVEPVAPEHVHHAILEVFKRRQARTADDLAPKLRARLVEAIEASGLNREDYTLRVANQRDPRAAELLEEAFAELSARQAKREALKRAFEASGKDVAAFAEMYGMDPREVRRALSPR